MNHIYRVIFNKTLRVMQAVSELGHRFGRGRTACNQDSTAAQNSPAWRRWMRLSPLCLALAFMLPGSAWAQAPTRTDCSVDTNTKSLECHNVFVSSQPSNPAFPFSSLHNISPDNYKNTPYTFADTSTLKGGTKFSVSNGYQVKFVGGTLDGTLQIGNPGDTAVDTDQHNILFVQNPSYQPLANLTVAQSNTVDLQGGGGLYVPGFVQLYADDDLSHKITFIGNGNAYFSNTAFSGKSLSQIENYKTVMSNTAYGPLILWDGFSGNLHAKRFVGTKDDDWSKFTTVQVSRSNVSFEKLPPVLDILDLGYPGDSTSPGVVEYTGNETYTGKINITSQGQDGKSPLKITGNPTFAKGSSVVVNKGSTVTTEGDANFGSALSGDGDVDVTKGNPTATTLPKGTTTVSDGTNLTYDGTTTPAGTLNLTGSNSTITAKPPAGKTLDLTDKLKDQPGKLNVAPGSTVSANNLPNGGTTVDAGSGLTYKNDQAPNGSITLKDSDSTLTADPGEGKTLDLSNMLKDQKGKLVVAPKGKVTATDLPDAGTTVDAGSGLTYKGDAQPKSSIVLKDGSTLKADPTSGTVDLGDKVKGTGSLDVADNANITASNLPDGGTTVNNGAGLTYQGNNPIKGNINLTDKSSTLTAGDTSGGTLDLGDKVQGDGKLAVVKGGKVSASHLPGAADIGAGSSLTYSGDGKLKTKIKMADGESTLTANPGKGKTLDLGDALDGQQGKLAVADNAQVEASKLPQGGTTVNGNLKYQGDETPAGPVVVNKDATLTAGDDSGSTLNLGNTVSGAGNLAIVEGSKVSADTLPTGETTVKDGAGLTYKGTGDLKGTIHLDNENSKLTAGVAGQKLDLGDKVSGAGSVDIAANSEVTATKLPDGGSHVKAAAALVYKGTEQPKSNIRLDDESSSLTAGVDGATVDLGNKVQGDGELKVAPDGKVSVSHLPGKGATVNQGSGLTYVGSDPINGNIQLTDPDSVINIQADPDKPLKLGKKVKGDGTLNVQKGTVEASALPAKADVSGTLSYTGDSADELGKVTLNPKSHVVINKSIDGLDLSKIKSTGDGGTVDLNADQTLNKLGTNNAVDIKGRDTTLTYTGGPDGLKNAKGIHNEGTVLLDNQKGDNNTNWGEAIDHIKGDGIGTSTIELKGDLISDKLSGNNTMKVGAGSHFTYSGSEAPTQKGQLELDRGSELKTTAPNLNLGDTLAGQKGNLTIAGPGQTASALPEGGTTVSDGNDLTFTGDKVPDSPIALPGENSTLKVKPADGKVLNLGNSLAGQKGRLEVEPGSQVQAQSLPDNTKLKKGAGLDYTGDNPPTGAIDLSDAGKVTFSNTVPHDFSKFTMGPGSSLVLNAPSKDPLDLSKIHGKGGSVVLNKDAQIADFGVGLQDIEVGPGANMTYNGDVNDILKKGIHIKNEGNLRFGGRGNLGDALANISGGGSIAITKGANITVNRLSNSTGAFSVEDGATVHVGGPGHQEPIFLKSMYLEGNVDFSNAGPVTLLDPGNEHLKPYPWFKNSFNFNPNRTTVVTHTSQFSFNTAQPNRTVGDYIIQGGELSYGSTLPQGEAHTNAFDGLLLVTIGGKAEFSAKGQGSETAKLTRVEANFYDGWWPKHLVDASSGGNIGGSVDSTPSADKDKEGGASGTGSSDASGAGSSTTNSGNGAASGSTPSDNNAASGSSPNAPAPTMMSLRAADPAATSTSSASAGNGDTASDNTGANEGAAGGTETDKPVAKELPTKPPVGDKPAPGRSQDKPCNPCFDQNQPEPSLAPGQLEKGGVLNVTLDNAYWVTHGFSQFHTLTTRNTAIVDYHNPEHDAKAVRVETLDGSFTLDMPLNTENFSLSGQFYAVKSGSDKAAASGAADNGTSGASTDNSASGASGAAAGNTAAGTESTQEAGNAASNNAASNNAGSTAAAAAKSVIQLVVPDYNPDDEAFSKNILVLKKTPLRVAVVPNNVSVVLQKTGREFMVGDSIYMYKIIHEPFKADKTYDNGDKTALNGYYNTVTFEDAEKDFANHTSYFLTIVEVASRNIGLSEPMRNEMQAGNELAYRISARLERMAPTYRTDLMDQRSKLWARADYHQGDLKQGASYRGFGVAFGLDHASAYGANSVLHMGLQGHVEKTHLVESSTQPLKLKQLNAGVSLYASYFNHDVYVGALAGYEFVAQNEPNFDVKTKMHAAKVSLETGVSFLTKGHFYILPEAQLQYTHFFANTVNGKHLGVGFVAKNKALKSLQGRLGLHVKKEHTLGAADIVWDVGMDYIHEFTAQQHFVGHRDLRLSTDVDYNYDLRDDQLQLSIGVDMKLGAHFGLGVGFEHRLDLDSTRTDQRVKAGLKWDF